MSKVDIEEYYADNKPEQKARLNKTYIRQRGILRGLKHGTIEPVKYNFNNAKLDAFYSHTKYNFDNNKLG
jgi:hypothetical protein